MSNKDQTNNLPKVDIIAENKQVKDTNELFRTLMVKMPIEEFKAKQKEIKEVCQWSRAVWFNKFHGITPLAPLELKAISEILGYPELFNN